MALSLALDLIGGPVFDGLSASVNRALDRKAAFTDLLQHMKCTLTSLRRQARHIREIQEHNLELGLSNNEIILLATKMGEGKVLVGRLSSIKFRLWLFCCCCCTSNCAEQLKELNVVLESLFETLHLEQLRDTKEILKLARQNHDDLEKMKVILQKILQIIDNPEVKGLLKNLVEHNSGGSMESSTSTSALGSNTKDEGNGGTQVASLEGLVEAAFRLLMDAVIEVKESSMMFRPLLQRLKSTLDCLRPFIEEMAQDNKVLDHPEEELEKLRMQMENGVNLISKCSSVCRWTSNKKDEYTNQVFELDEFLQGQLSILTVKVTRDVKGTSELIRNIKEVVKRIEGSDMVQNQDEFQGSCDITEPPIPPVEFQGSCDITEFPIHQVEFQL
ncbi:hypothetical protein M0R45_001425 [Rubus argutus]|uniref:RPW8 domain-containing protein n=1 Tax=Rubus argutus TaxID=59490 RepID=A0AAW1VLN8_RUBAR